MRRRDALRAGGALLGAGLLPGRAVADAAGVAGSDATGVGDSDVVGSDGYEPIGRLDLEGTKEAVVGPDGEAAYLALTNGYATVDLSDPSNPAVLAERRGLREDAEAGALRQVYDVKHDDDTLAVVGPANPGVEGSSGALLVDVSDPGAPGERAFFGTDYPIHNCFLDGSTLYLTGNGAGGNPLVVVDVGGGEPTELARWSLTDHEAAWRDVAPGLRVLHDVWVNDGLAALVYWDAGTYLLDVSDPAAPEHVGTVPAGDPAELADPPAREALLPPGNHHYAATDPANDLLAIGMESWGALVDEDGEYEGGPSGVELYDVSDPSEPELLSAVASPESPDPTYSGVWTTAHNLEFRDGTLYTSWYQGGVKRHDLTDPTDPVEETWWVDPDETSFWTARTAVPDEFFVASSMDIGETTAGLWTFPDEPGVGGNPDALAEGGSTDAPGATGTSTATSSPTTATPPPAATPTATSTGSPTETAGSGFGALATLGGASLALLRALGGR
ncbi:LVIVD repeat-containing protein [Halorarum salinum]|uniref:LVIVD repeat-containing protein n=1 Tax=Halorarum salinum TaxID=2743089 RepID=A0A7D5LD17_9EURY|nr:hypothetical protein [Halobaculum salinum]QLG63812.1 hypothetical protein HUG12_19625 [Halobaculum salinum]